MQNDNNNSSYGGENPPAVNQQTPANQMGFSMPANAPYPIQNSSAMIKKRKVVGLSAFDVLTMIANFFLTFFLILNVVWKDGFTWKITAIYFGFFALASTFIAVKTHSFSKKAIFPAAAAIILAIGFSLHSTPGFNLVAFLAIIYLSTSYCINLTGSAKHSGGSYFYLLDIIKCVLLIPLKNVFLPFLSLSTLRKPSANNEKGKGKIIVGVILGIVCAVPVLLVVVPLLINSDAAFESILGTAYSTIERWIENIFDFAVSDDTLWETAITIIPAIICSSYIYSVMFSFRHNLTKNENDDTSKEYKKLRVVPSNIIAGFLGIISIVYLIYLLSQFAYFFSAFAGKLPGGMEITVTEYARRGFFEMAKIAAVNFVIIAATVIFSKRFDGKLSTLVKCFDLFLCVFTLILTATSISKIVLYITEMGLTPKRFYVFAFDIILIFSFVSVIIRLFKKSFPYMKVITAAVCTVLCLISVLGVENIIIRYNSDFFLAGKMQQSDIYEIEGGAYESVKLLCELSKSQSSVIAKSANDALTDKYADDIKSCGSEKYGNAVYNNLDDVLRHRFIKKNAAYLNEIYNNNYIDCERVYVFFNTKTKIKSIKVQNYDYVLMAGDREASKTENFEMITFDSDYTDSKIDYDAETISNYYRIEIIAENGKQSVIYSDSNCAEIVETDSGFELNYPTLKDIMVTRSAAYNFLQSQKLAAQKAS